MNIEDFPKLSSNNRDELPKHIVAGCYACVNIFSPSDVKEFVDQGKTAICPRCDVDAVLPGVANLKLLSDGMERWFTGRG